MKKQPDKSFDLACVDPPYGIGMDANRASQEGRYGYKKYKKTDWDKTSPQAEYFVELRRISKNQIIWGANHFIDKIAIGSPCWLVWDKDNGKNDNADCELAWTSFKTAVRKFKKHIASTFSNRIHPTQKPVKLYQWIFDNYAEKGQRIFDSHLGSASSAIAAHYAGLDFVGCELDKDYFEAAKDRVDKCTRQQTFDF
jgi:site-specific DNA-methyltransferase (adenine-specific)